MSNALFSNDPVMLQAVRNRLKEGIHWLRHAFSDRSPEVKCIGSNPVETMRYVEADSKKRGLLNRQASKRLTLPKKWLDDSAWGKDDVHMGLWKDPETGEFLGIFIKLEPKKGHE